TPHGLNLMMAPVEVETPFKSHGKENVEQNQNGSSRRESSSETNPILAGLQLASNSLEQAKAATKPEMEKAWDDVRKFEFKVEHEAPQRPAQPLQAPAAVAESAQK